MFISATGQGLCGPREQLVKGDGALLIASDIRTSEGGRTLSVETT
jgi:hypothetical protein